MSGLVRLPHSLMRRYLSLLERILVAAGLAGLLYGLLSSLPVYPRDWDMVILAAVFVAALWWPAVAYFMAVAVAAYPLYTLSLYVAVLFLAVALLGRRVFILTWAGWCWCWHALAGRLRPGGWCRCWAGRGAAFRRGVDGQAGGADRAGRGRMARLNGLADPEQQFPGHVGGQTVWPGRLAGGQR
jgi:hypothetical protein